MVTGFAVDGGLGIEGVAGTVGHLGGRLWTLAGLDDRPLATRPGRLLKVPRLDEPKRRCYHRQAFAGRDAGGLAALQP